MKILIILLFLSMVPAAVAPGVNTSVCAETDHSAVTSTQEWDANNLRTRIMQYQSPACASCIANCHQTRIGCLANACRSAGGHPTDKEGVCDSPTNQAVLQAGSKQCYANDSRCQNSCPCR